MAADAHDSWLVAARISAAYAAGDLDAFSELLDPDVRWGGPDDPAPACRSRADVLAWYRRGRDGGGRAEVIETTVVGGAVVVGLRVAGWPAQDGGAGERWQVLQLRAGRVVDIVGYPTRAEATARAGQLAGAGPPALP